MVLKLQLQEEALLYVVAAGQSSWKPWCIWMRAWDMAVLTALAPA
jgi:hypothetical protein